VIFSDYNKGFFGGTEGFHPPSLYPNSKTIVDPKCGPIKKWKGCTVFKPNAKEAAELSGKTFWKEQAKFFQHELECEAVVITASGDRVSGVWKDQFFCYTPTKRVDVTSSVGAGDCFCAFFAMCIGHGFGIPEAAEIAYNAGSVYVQHNMNRPVCPAELIEDSIVVPEDLKNRDFNLVFTNGCFDVLHKGHLETLKFAKSKGDKLVVAVNSDASVRRLKGDSRPVVPLEHRMAVLANLKCVDFVVSFDEDTPLQVIKKIKPDVLVKGGDYEKEKIIGADLVEEVFTAPMIEGLSSTSILAGNHLQQQD
jgi:D-beta-D-heptose 7-phosphate kinase/D-beta-D-heptose 1-phosphate adenosyltransferase